MLKNFIPKTLPWILLLLLIITIIYWVPLFSWLFQVLIQEHEAFPIDLSFGKLVYRTLGISSIVAFLSVIFAYPIAVIWRLYNQYIQRIIISLMVIPLIMGLLARNYSWIGLLSNSDPITSLGFALIGGRSILYTVGLIYIVMTCVFVPIAFFMIMQGLRSVTYQHVDSARTLGLPDWKIVFLILFRMSYRSALLAFSFILALSSGFVITPHMIGGGKFDFISNAILTYVNFGSFGTASIVAAAFLCIILFPLIFIMIYSLRLRKLTIGQ